MVTLRFVKVTTLESKEEVHNTLVENFLSLFWSRQSENFRARQLFNGVE